MYRLAREFDVREKQALTTGEVAKYCGVNFRTVIRWIERGHLDAYKLPGRGDNRIPVESFINFLQSNNMPVPEELVANKKCLLVLTSSDECSIELASLARRTGWEALLTRDPMQFGYLLAVHQPQAIIVTTEEQSACLGRILRDTDASDLLLVRLGDTASTEPDKNWQQIKWPQDQAKLAALFSQDNAQ